MEIYRTESLNTEWDRCFIDDNDKQIHNEVKSRDSGSGFRGGRCPGFTLSYNVSELTFVRRQESGFVLNGSMQPLHIMDCVINYNQINAVSMYFGRLTHFKVRSLNKNINAKGVQWKVCEDASTCLYTTVRTRIL